MAVVVVVAVEWLLSGGQVVVKWRSNGSSGQVAVVVEWLWWLSGGGS